MKSGRWMLTLLMTRPTEAAKRFVTQLPPKALAQLTPLYSPLITIEPTVSTLDMGDARGLIFTSANAVETAAKLTDHRGHPCFCVGEATTLAAKNAGWQASFSGQNAEALIKTLHQTPPIAPLLHLRGTHARGTVAARLTVLGCTTREQIIYDQPTLPFNSAAKAALANPAPVIAPLFSPRTARQFAQNATFTAPLFLATLSEAVAKPVKSLQYNRLLVCDQPNAQAMTQRIVELLNDAKRVEGMGPAQ